MPEPLDDTASTASSGDGNAEDRLLPGIDGLDAFGDEDFVQAFGREHAIVREEYRKALHDASCADGIVEEAVQAHRANFALTQEIAELQELLSKENVERQLLRAENDSLKASHATFLEELTKERHRHDHAEQEWTEEVEHHRSEVAVFEQVVEEQKQVYYRMIRSFQFIQ